LKIALISNFLFFYLCLQRLIKGFGKQGEENKPAGNKQVRREKGKFEKIIDAAKTVVFFNNN
jgi:hypothetical protein